MIYPMMVQVDLGSLREVGRRPGGLALTLVWVRLAAPDVALTEAAIGTGPVDSVYKAINRIVQVPNELTEFSIKAVTEGIDAVGEVTIRIEPTNGGNAHSEPTLTQTGPRRRTYSGHGADQDIIVASAKAYMSALNKMLTAVKAETKA